MLQTQVVMVRAGANIEFIEGTRYRASQYIRLYRVTHYRCEKKLKKYISSALYRILTPALAETHEHLVYRVFTCISRTEEAEQSTSLSMK